MEEEKYILICARGAEKGPIFAKVTEEMRRQMDEAFQKERERLMEIMKILEEPSQMLSDLEELKEKPKREPTPEEIKRRLKYAKNPMEIQQLNRQLAMTYKEQRRKKY